jgi:hypothetical protein
MTSTTSSVSKKISKSRYKQMAIHACDKYDRKVKNARFYITSQSDPNYMEYTDNPIAIIHDHAPKNISIDTYDFESNYLGLYVNCLINEGYKLDAKKATTPGDIMEDGSKGTSVWGHTMYFKRKHKNTHKRK